MNTRFNPTANGPLHIGHIYMALLNEQMAHASGGKFHVRFDDNCPHMMRLYVRQIPGRSFATREKADLQHYELRWMGLDIDSVSYESESEEKLNQFLAARDFRWGSDSVGYGYSTKPVIAGTVQCGAFVMVTRHTVQKVVDDYWNGANVLIRGLEWLAEHHLYMYFCALFGFRFPKCYYVPRLIMAREKAMSRDSGEAAKEISKTIGNWSIPELREAGISPQQIRRELRESCLVDPGGLWDVSNLRGQPRLISREVKDVLGR